MITRIQKNKSIPNYFNITYHVTETCNYHCPYCFNLKKPKKDTSPFLIENISKKINSIIKEIKNKNIDFHLIGGEVTIFDIKNLILKNIDLNNLYRFSLVTNLSRDVKYYEELLQDINIRTRVKASFHPTEISKDEFLQKIIKLQKYNIIVSLLITKQYYYDVEKFYNKLKRLNIPVSVSVERVDGIPINTDSKIIDKDMCKFTITYDNDGQKVLTKYALLNELKTLKGYKCDANNSRLIIDPQGYIKNGCPKQNKKENIFQYHYYSKEDITCNSNKLCTLYSINEVYK